MNEKVRQHSCPAPRGFRPAGEVVRAWFSDEAPCFRKAKRVKSVRAAGIRYERKALAHLCAEYSEFVPSPWLRFENGSSRSRWCQPDGVLLDIKQGRIVLVECKLQHTSNAWWQTRRLYEPVLQKIFGTAWKYSVVEMVRWFDPAVTFPETFSFAEDLFDVEPGAFGIHIWNGTN